MSIQKKLRELALSAMAAFGTVNSVEAGPLVDVDLESLPKFESHVGAALNLNNDTGTEFDVMSMQFRALDSTSKLPNLICVNGDESRPQGVDYDMIQVKLADSDTVLWEPGLQGATAAYNVMMDEQLDAQWAVLYLNMLPVAVVVKTDDDQLAMADSFPRYVDGERKRDIGPCPSYM